MRPETHVLKEFLNSRAPLKRYPNVFLTSQGHLIVFNPDPFALAGLFAVDIIMNFSNTYKIDTINKAIEVAGKIKSNEYFTNASYMYTYITQGKFAYLMSLLIENRIILTDLLSKDYFVDKSITMFYNHIEEDKVYTPLVYKPKNIIGYMKNKPFSNCILVNPYSSINDNSNVIPNYEEADVLFNIIMDSGVKNLSVVGIKDGTLTEPIEYIDAIYDNIVHTSVESLQEKYLSLSKDISKKYNLYDDRDITRDFMDLPVVLKDNEDADEEDIMFLKAFDILFPKEKRMKM